MIEYARNVLGMSQAQSTEFNPATPQPVVVFMPEGSTTHMGGTMRLGSRRTLFQTVDCITSKLCASRVFIAFDWNCVSARKSWAGGSAYLFDRRIYVWFPQEFDEQCAQS